MKPSTQVFSHVMGREKWPVGEVANEDRRKWSLSTRVIVGTAGVRLVGTPKNLTLDYLSRCLHVR